MSEVSSSSSKSSSNCSYVWEDDEGDEEEEDEVEEDTTTSSYDMVSLPPPPPSSSVPRQEDDVDEYSFANSNDETAVSWSITSSQSQSQPSSCPPSSSSSSSTSSSSATDGSWDRVGEVAVITAAASHPSVDLMDQGTPTTTRSTSHVRDGDDDEGMINNSSKTSSSSSSPPLPSPPALYDCSEGLASFTYDGRMATPSSRWGSSTTASSPPPSLPPRLSRPGLWIDNQDDDDDDDDDNNDYVNQQINTNEHQCYCQQIFHHHHRRNCKNSICLCPYLQEDVLRKGNNNNYNGGCNTRTRNEILKGIIQILQDRLCGIDNIPILVATIEYLSDFYYYYEEEGHNYNGPKHYTTSIYLVSNVQHEIITVMKDFPFVKVIQHVCCDTICKLSNTTNRRIDWIQLGGYECIVKALKFFSCDELVAKRSIQALRAISIELQLQALSTTTKSKSMASSSSSSHWSSCLQTHHVSTSIYRAMRIHSKSIPIQRDGCALLSNCAIDPRMDNNNNQVAIVSWEELSTVLQAMKDHPHDPSILATGYLAIQNYSFEVQNCYLLVKELKAIKLLFTGGSFLQMYENLSASLPPSSNPIQLAQLLDRLNRIASSSSSSSSSCLTVTDDERINHALWWCHVCCMDLQSQKNLKLHCDGRKHRMRLQDQGIVFQFPPRHDGDILTMMKTSSTKHDSTWLNKGTHSTKPTTTTKSLSHARVESLWGTNTNALFESFAHPPYHLLHTSGGLEGAFTKAMETNPQRFVLLNIQQYKESFGSSAINRDVWSDSLVQDIIQSSFIFYQTTNDTRDGSAFIHHFKVKPQYPYVAILNPKTRHILWKRQDWSAEQPWSPNRIAESMMDICSRYENDLLLRSPSSPSEGAKEKENKTSEGKKLQGNQSQSNDTSSGNNDDEEKFAIEPIMNFANEYDIQEAVYDNGDLDYAGDVSEFYDLQQALLLSQM